jgi:hypothetical protein
MEKVEEYRRRAAECRDHSKHVSPDIQGHYLDLAAMWDRLADERLTFFIPKDKEDA